MHIKFSHPHFFRSDRNILCRQPSDPYFFTDQSPSSNLVFRRSNTTPLTTNEPAANPVSSVNPFTTTPPHGLEILNSAHHLDSIEENSAQISPQKKEIGQNDEITSVSEDEGLKERGDGETVKTEGGESAENVVITEGDVGGAPLTRVSSVDPNLKDSPAFKFITRPDLYKFAKVCVYFHVGVVPFPCFNSRRNGMKFSLLTWLYWNRYKLFVVTTPSLHVTITTQN